MSLEYDYGRNRLAGLPRGAIFFASGDDVIYPTFYLQLVEAFRADVVAIPEGFLLWPPSRARIAKAVPEAAAVLASPPWTRTEDVWSRDVADAALRAGRPCAMTNPSREDVVAGLHREVRDVVYEIYRGRPYMRPGQALWMRTRGWDRDRRALTVRQGWLIGLCGKYQRQYADVLANAGMTAESLPRFRRALAIPELPDREGAANNYALALERAGRREDAVAVWERLMRAGSRSPEVWLNAGNLLLGLGRREDARRAFQAALARSGPDGPYAAYARRQLGRLGPPL
jgi:tetratricopeptide (TPR) repeat protein